MNTKIHSCLIVFFISFAALSFAQLPNYVPTSSLVAWYSFNGNANDLSGNSYHGTPQNGVALTADRFSNSNSAYSFDGVDDRIFINQNFFDNGWTNLSISFWMNLTSVSNPNNGQHNNPTFNTSPHNGLDMGCNWSSSGKYSLWAGNGAPSASWNVLSNAQSIQAAVAGTWKMITIIKHDSTYAFYINGSLDNTWTGSQHIQSYLYKFYIGGTDPIAANETFNGTLDDFGIWNRALTTCEISELYAAALIPNISVSASNTILCTGQSAILTVSGTATYSWSTGGSTASISVSPSVATVYSVTGTSSSGCVHTSTTQITVYNTPTLVANSASICPGQTATISVSGAPTYSWSNGSTTSSIVVTATASLNYAVIGTNTNGCSNIAAVAVTVYSLPVVASASASACAGGSATLLASGAATYSWTGTSVTAASIVVTPTAITVYTVTGTSAQGCVNTTTTEVTIEAAPSLTVSAAPACAGSTITVSANGASTYAWSNGATAGSFTAVPAINTSYTVTGTSAQGCTSSAVATLTVNALPTVTFGTLTSALCVSDNTITLSGLPAGGTFAGSGVSGSVFIPSIAGVGTYTLTYNYTDANNCHGSDSRVITVNVCTGIKEEKNTTGIYVYPNPAQDVLYIHTEQLSGLAKVKLFDANGKEVYSSDLSSTPNALDISGLSRGFYFITVAGQNGNAVMKFIKN